MCGVWLFILFLKNKLKSISCIVEWEVQYAFNESKTVLNLSKTFYIKEHKIFHKIELFINLKTTVALLKEEKPYNVLVAGAMKSLMKVAVAFCLGLGKL